jgi:hypothetical protein
MRHVFQYSAENAGKAEFERKSSQCQMLTRCHQISQQKISSPNGTRTQINRVNARVLLRDLIHPSSFILFLTA